jgi:hypothetical protein
MLTIRTEVELSDGSTLSIVRHDEQIKLVRKVGDDHQVFVLPKADVYHVAARLLGDYAETPRFDSRRPRPSVLE